MTDLPADMALVLTFLSQRIQCMPLPFRTSPTIKHTRLFSQARRNAPKPLYTQTVTPADSEEEPSPPFGPVDSMQSPQTLQPATSWGEEVNTQLDAAMDMGISKQPFASQHLDLDAMILSPKASPCSLLPPQAARLGLSDMSNGGRLPTPIYGHFQQSMDTPMEGTSLPVQTPSPSESEYEQMMRSRRLPTPISEDEAMDVFETPSEAMPEIPLSQLRKPARFAPPLPYQSTKRSKPMFSMGFRADCEMCRDRVPGHYNHIFRA